MSHFKGLIYSGSQDRTIGVWRPDGVYCRGLKGHAHWVNSLAVNTAYVTRTGAFEPAEAKHTNVLSKDPKGIRVQACLNCWSFGFIRYHTV